MPAAAGSNRFKNPLPGVPDVESPFFERLFAEKDVSPETLRIARDMRTKGYAVIDFPDPDLTARAERIVGTIGPKFDLPTWREHGWPGGHSLRIQDAWQDNADVAAIAANPAILQILASLYGRAAFPFQTLNFPVGTQQPFHTDSIHFSSMPERFMCGVWVALEDIDAENGPLEYYPGSHKLPIYVNEHVGACAQIQATPDAHYGDYINLWRELVASEGYERETFHARKGQALIWSANLLHGGSKQLNPNRTRWSQVTHYYFDGCAYFTPLMSDPPSGKTFFRDVIDVGTRDHKPNMYVGQPIAADVIDRARPSFLGAPQGMAAANNVLPKDFDPAAYLRANPDVAAAGVDPVRHYRTHGWKEGRRLR